MSETQVALSQVIAELMAISEVADRVGQASVHGACFAAAMMLAESAREDGLEVDRDAFGFMSGSFEG